jgi:hypothetical protein
VGTECCLCCLTASYINIQHSDNKINLSLVLHAPSCFTYPNRVDVYRYRVVMPLLFLIDAKDQSLTLLIIQLTKMFRQYPDEPIVLTKKISKVKCVLLSVVLSILNVDQIPM